MSSNNTINSNNSPGSINKIEDNKKPSDDRAHEGKTLWEKTKWLRWVFGTILVLIGLYFSYTQLMNNNNEINANNSPGSINTIGQTGGINIVNNNLSIPDPVITVETLETNTEKDGKYFSEFLMNIESQVQIPNLYLQANAASITSFDVVSQRSDMAMFGHSGTREGFAFTNIQQVYGKYKLRVTTEKPEEITFEGNID